MKNLAQDKFLGIYVALPPFPEQQAIAAFLDQQCAQIDSLIEKKQRMLDLLDEKRRAVITQAVTRGLDPTVPMKDSGVGWLSMVPEGWEVKKGRFIGRIASTSSLLDQELTSSFDDACYCYIKVSDLNSNDNTPNFKVSEMFSMSFDYSPTCNSLIFPKRGAAIFTNKIAILEKEALLDPNMMSWEIFEDFDIKYMMYVVSGRTLNDLADTSTVPQINNKHIYPTSFPAPPLPEQQAIADYLDAQCAAMDSQRKNLEKSIELLREYRASLITHAVTGKIDVREVAPLQ